MVINVLYHVCRVVLASSDIDEIHIKCEGKRLWSERVHHGHCTGSQKSHVMNVGVPIPCLANENCAEWVVIHATGKCSPSVKVGKSSSDRTHLVTCLSLLPT